MTQKYKPLRICLLMQGGSGWQGGIQYIKNIINALSYEREKYNPLEIHLICEDDTQATELKDMVHIIDHVYIRSRDIDRGLFGNKFLCRVIRYITTCDLALAVFLKSKNINFIFPFISKKSWIQPYNSAAWVPDFQHKLHTEFSNQSDLVDRDRAFDRIMKNSAKIVVSSRDAQKDFDHFYKPYIQKARVVPFKVQINDSWLKADVVTTQKKYALPDKFFLICNQFWKHKGHNIVLHALHIISKRNRSVMVVCTGRLFDYRHPDYADQILQSISSFGISDQVRLMGVLPREHQIQLMRRSLAVIQPSLFEGWNTSVEEARALGKKVILSDLDIHKEQNPPGSIYYKRDSAEELALLIEQCWESLSPGPDLSEEKRAIIQNQNELREFRSEFIKLASESD